MGDHTFAVVARDMYDGPSAGVAPPNPASVTASGSSLTVKLRSVDPLTVNAGAGADFRLVGSAVTVSSVVYQAGGTLLLTLSGTPTNNNISALASIQFRFGAPAVTPMPPAPPPAAAPSYMVFFDWDRSNLSAQALNTIKQAANAFKTKGNARITATGHTDKSGPENYNMALSLRRANAVKDALVREGVPATAIAVIGRGESQPLVPTADGVREPQNRRVEIVFQ